jgi:hypothetical protein
LHPADFGLAATRAGGATGRRAAERHGGEGVAALGDGMDMDECASPALYFGITTGQLWMGRDGGEKWECLFDALPPIHCVKAAVV